MRLPDVLQGVLQLGFDTAPLIYFVERHPDYFDRMLSIMRYIDAGRIAGTASTIALTEVLVQPLRVGDAELAKRYEVILSDSRNFRLEAITSTTARLAAELRAKHNLRIADALHVATAVNAGCDAFLTNDTGIKQVAEITVLVIDELEIEPLTPL